MITLEKGDIFATPGDHSFAHGVNCVGAMGKGVALQFKSEWPELLPAYQRHCKIGALRPGGWFVWALRPKGTQCRLIYNIAVKDHWEQPAQLQWVLDGVSGMLQHASLVGVETIVMPLLGCGLGGLDWKVVKPHLINICQDSPVHVRLCVRCIAGSPMILIPTS